MSMLIQAIKTEATITKEGNMPVKKITDGLLVVINKINVLFFDRKHRVHFYIFFNCCSDKFLNEMPRVNILAVTAIKEIGTD